MTATWGLVIDVARCHDCNNCFLACKDEFVGNDWPPYSRAQPERGQRWLDILRRERGGYPLVAVAYLPKPCQHCKHPPCLKAARNGAVSIREDGIVLIDAEKAAGQKQLVEACPYGAIYWNEAAQIPQKCSLCAHLLDGGWQAPRCVQACPTEAIRIQKREPAEWQRVIQEQGLAAFAAEQGCAPRVLYKNLKRFTHGFIAGSVVLADTDDCAENAHVLVKNENGQTLAQTVTDNYGDFKLDGLREQASKLVVEIEVDGLPAKLVTMDFEASINLGTIFV